MHILDYHHPASPHGGSHARNHRRRFVEMAQQHACERDIKIRVRRVFDRTGAKRHVIKPLRFGLRSGEREHFGIEVDAHDPTARSRSPSQFQRDVSATAAKIDATRALPGRTEQIEQAQSARRVVIRQQVHPLANTHSTVDRVLRHAHLRTRRPRTDCPLWRCYASG
jgi:hypothetical protein